MFSSGRTGKASPLSAKVPWDLQLVRVNHNGPDEPVPYIHIVMGETFMHILYPSLIIAQPELLHCSGYPFLYRLSAGSTAPLFACCSGCGTRVASIRLCHQIAKRRKVQKHRPNWFIFIHIGIGAERAHVHIGAVGGWAALSSWPPCLFPTCVQTTDQS